MIYRLIRGDGDSQNPEKCFYREMRKFREHGLEFNFETAEQMPNSGTVVNRKRLLTRSYATRNWLPILVLVMTFMELIA